MPPTYLTRTARSRKSVFETFSSLPLPASFLEGKGTVWLLQGFPPLLPTLVESLTIPVFVALSLSKRSRAVLPLKRLAGPSNSSCQLLFLPNFLYVTSLVLGPSSSPASRPKPLALPLALARPIRVSGAVPPCCTLPFTRLMLARPTRSSKTLKLIKALPNFFPFVPDSPIQKTLLSALCTAPRLRPLLAAGLTIHCVTERCSSQVKCELA